MRLSEYQAIARTTAVYPKEFKVIYPVMGLCGETGEVAEKIKKWIRDHDKDETKLDKEAVTKELGDVLWYLANIASDLGINFNDVAADNVKKLQSRKERGAIHGSGDNR